MKKNQKVPSPYTIAGYLEKIIVVILVIVFIIWAIKFMGPLNSLIF